MDIFNRHNNRRQTRGSKMKFLKKSGVCQECAYLEELHAKLIRTRPDLTREQVAALIGSHISFCCRRGKRNPMNLEESKSAKPCRHFLENSDYINLEEIESFRKEDLERKVMYVEIVSSIIIAIFTIVIALRG